LQIAQHIQQQGDKYDRDKNIVDVSIIKSMIHAEINVELK
jgi:hypothetical protein